MATHWRYGWFFERRPNGDRVITKRADGHEGAAVEATCVIPSGEWPVAAKALGVIDAPQALDPVPPRDVPELSEEEV